jgi:hypothetical protein
VDDQLDHDDNSTPAANDDDNNNIDNRLLNALSIERAQRWHRIAVVGLAVGHRGFVPSRQWIHVKCSWFADKRLELGTERLQPTNSDLRASKHCPRKPRKRHLVQRLYALSFQRVRSDDW